jgi:Asp-tRNA(Asn)/Glu-tRNA(Gln) amidotransferase A subunit family amidase
MPLPSPRRRSFVAAVADFSAARDTPEAFLERCLADMATFEPEVGAFVHVEIEAARDSARASTQRWKAGAPLSRIDGMPVGIKDLIETADMPTQCGSPVFEGYQSHLDAASVVALRQAGAIILGKTVTTEFAARVPRGPRNPWDTSRTPGGTSSASSRPLRASATIAQSSMLLRSAKSQTGVVSGPPKRWRRLARTSKPSFGEGLGMILRLRS